MNITTRAQNFEMSSAIDEYCRDTIRTALHRFREEIVAVDIFVKDTNGPKGGIDKQALIRVQLRNRQVLALETTHENLYAAIKQTAKRAKRAVRRHLRKYHRFENQRISERLNDPGMQTAT